ncbi:MAG: GNAT family N-acetyltransferase [Acidobacteriota bacterium]
MSVQEPTLRPAVPDEVGVLTEIAREAKRSRGYPEEWLALWWDELSFTTDTLKEQEVTVAEIDGRQVGVVALMLKEDDADLDDLWVLPEHHGSGVGSRLFEEAVAQARRHGVSSLRIVSDPDAEEFYLRRGAVRVGSVPSKPAPRRLPELRLDLSGGA